ncbi:MAG: hypothetical protein GKR89_15825 [Candidatus Latescibacteria bacterium]|nr:hypothetical protein [Candidatus Latescibacterota bacterium]
MNQRPTLSNLLRLSRDVEPPADLVPHIMARINAGPASYYLLSGIDWSGGTDLVPTTVRRAKALLTYAEYTGTPFATVAASQQPQRIDTGLPDFS